MTSAVFDSLFLKLLFETGQPSPDLSHVLPKFVDSHHVRLFLAVGSVFALLHIIVLRHRSPFLIKLT
jgi:hypothetical protein